MMISKMKNRWNLRMFWNMFFPFHLTTWNTPVVGDLGWHWDDLSLQRPANRWGSLLRLGWVEFDVVHEATMDFWISWKVVLRDKGATLDKGHWNYSYLVPDSARKTKRCSFKFPFLLVSQATRPRQDANNIFCQWFGWFHDSHLSGFIDWRINKAFKTVKRLLPQTWSMSLRSVLPIPSSSSCATWSALVENGETLLLLFTYDHLLNHIQQTLEKQHFKVGNTSRNGTCSIGVQKCQVSVRLPDWQSHRPGHAERNGRSPLLLCGHGRTLKLLRTDGIQCIWYTYMHNI